MENQIQLFKNEQFGDVRTVLQNGEPWFVAADVCRCIGLGNVSSVINRLDDEEKRKYEIETSGGKQTLNFVNKNGLIVIVCGSRKEIAKRFKNWISTSVFPALGLRWSLDDIYQQETVCASSELSVYNSAEFGSVRVHRDENNDPWFVAADACRILSLSDTSQAMERIDDEDKRVFRGIRTANNTLFAWCVNESGLYSLIIESNKPEAKAFRRWITHEVIPSIRKHGLYAADELLANPDLFIKVLQDLKEERARAAQLATQNAVQSQQIAEMQPKVSYYDLILQNQSVMPIVQIAKDYGFSAQAMNQKLREFGVQYKSGGVWLLYQKYAPEGYTQTKTYLNDDGACNVHTYWTQKGRLFLYDLLKQKGILPRIEQNNEEVCA